jgi:ABC-type lipoprotein export system ATPase subunit
MEGLSLEGVEVPGDKTSFLSVDRRRQCACLLSRDAAAAVLRAVAGIRSRTGRPARVRRVLVDGADVTGEPPHLRKLGYVPAGGGLRLHQTVWENILSGASDDLRQTGADEASARQLADGLNLTASLTLLPQDLLSAEEHLKVALARAAMSEPHALVVHIVQPTDPTDRLTGATVERLLKRAVLPRATPPATLVLTDDEVLHRHFPEAAPPGRRVRATRPMMRTTTVGRTRS